jgi:hypothetical protein
MLKLSKLPDRKPVKITFWASAELNRSLALYADLYRERYGEAEQVPDLIPYMLETFLKADSEFVKARREEKDSTSTHSKAKANSSEKKKTPEPASSTE